MGHNAEAYQPSVNNVDATRPPHFNCRNIGCGCRQVFGEDDGGADRSALWPTTEALLQRIVRDELMAAGDVSDDGGSLLNGDEGLEDHQRDQHDPGADIGHHHVQDTRNLLGHHHHCECPICPYRIASSIHEWMRSAFDPETTGSMYAEPSSGELSMASSVFLETRPQTPGPQLLAEIGSWPPEPGHFPQDREYITSPLWLVPERMVPHQLDTCIPEESEPASDDEHC